jgi:type VI secretion system secreted protein Hcp
MAETVHLTLKVNGAIVQGDSSQTTLGRADTIECLSYRQAYDTGRTSSGMATGRRTYEPLAIRKRIDRSSPVLARALAQNSVIEGVFKFYRPNPAGDGTIEQFYTTEIKQGRISAITQSAPDIEAPSTVGEQPFEEVAFVFGRISWTWTAGGVTWEDTLIAMYSAASTAETIRSVDPAAAQGSPAPGSNGSQGAPEPLRPTVLERGELSRVAAIRPLSEVEDRLELARRR